MYFPLKTASTVDHTVTCHNIHNQSFPVLLETVFCLGCSHFIKTTLHMKTYILYHYVQIFRCVCLIVNHKIQVFCILTIDFSSCSLSY